MAVLIVKSILRQWALLDVDNAGGEQPVEDDKEEEEDWQNSPWLLIDQVGSPPAQPALWEVESAEGNQLGDADEEKDKATLQPDVDKGEVGGLGDDLVDAVAHGGHRDQVGDLDVVLGLDAGSIGGEVHGDPGEEDEEEGGAVELEHVVGEVALEVNGEDETGVGAHIVVRQVPAHWELKKNSKVMSYSDLA